MHSTFGVLTRALGSVLLSTVAMACHESIGVEDVMTGTEITVETQDGRVVSGTVAAVNPASLVLTTNREDARITIARQDIREMRRAEDGAAVAKSAEVVVPIGATLDVTLETALAANASQPEDPVRGTLAVPFAADGVTIAPAGSTVVGSVTVARPSGRVQGRAELGFRFDQLQTDGMTYEIRTAPLHYTADATKADDAKKIGIGAAAGAVIGGIAGGGKGAAVGSAIGAGGGTAVVLATPGEDVRLGAGTRLRVTLAESLTVLSPIGGK